MATTTVHKTRLGMLKSAMEWSRPTPGVWWVEGWQIEKWSRTRYRVTGPQGPGHDAPTLTDAFEYVADKELS